MFGTLRRCIRTVYLCFVAFFALTACAAVPSATAPRIPPSPTVLPIDRISSIGEGLVQTATLSDTLLSRASEKLDKITPRQ